MSKSNLNILILCGGTGPRLWPLSRADHPKQFLSLFSQSSLLEQTINRALKIVPSENVYIISNEIYSEKLKKLTRKLIPVINIILEPLKRNTAQAIIYAASVIKKNNPDAVIASMPSDHYIKNIKQFKSDIVLAANIAKTTSSIVTLGINPNKPDPSYGYILPKINKNHFYPIIKYVEKPDLKTINRLFKKHAFWNSGMYFFSVKTLENELKLIDQEFYQIFLKLSAKDITSKQITDIYLNSNGLPFDKVVSEKSKNMYVVPAKFEWSDVGEWETIYLNLKKNKNGHAVINQSTKLISYNSSNCLINGDQKKIIGMVGVKNLAIIDTSDSLLVCNLENSYDVRELISLIVKDHKLKSYFLTQNDKS